MSSRILITADSTTDLTPDLIERYGVKILPLGITLGDVTYKDGVDVTPEDIRTYYKETGLLPKTSSPNLGDTEDFFRQYTEKGFSIVHFSLSSALSSSYSNACLAAQSFDNVFVVDTENLSFGGGILVVEAAKMAERGMDAEAIADACRSLAKRVDTTFVIDSLEFLHKGGRCSALSVLGANLLKIKPCIAVRNGSMNIAEKYRGKFEKVVRDYLFDLLGDRSDIEPGGIHVFHAGCTDEVVRVTEDTVKEILGTDDVTIPRAGCTIFSHCGPDTVGIFLLRKTPVGK